MLSISSLCCGAVLTNSLAEWQIKQDELSSFSGDDLKRIKLLGKEEYLAQLIQRREDLGNPCKYDGG